MSEEPSAVIDPVAATPPGSAETYEAERTVTALSEWTEAEVRRNGKVYVQEYERGKATTDVKEIGAASRTGTKITFKPDPEIFHDAAFDYDMLEARLRELAFLNKGLAIKL